MDQFKINQHHHQSFDQEPIMTKEKTRRPVRNKRYNRRHFGEERRPPKRLFTPEIKKFLKDWLIRRRENPYPNRDEKKVLAIQTGLTYIQVCNWFANWRRKLKNAGKEPQRKTWGHLIKTYNSQVHGNVEHFSICSEDSIWHELEHEKLLERDDDDSLSSMHLQKTYNLSGYVHQSVNGCQLNNKIDPQQQCFLISSTTIEEEMNPFAQQHQTSKYKSHIMEKYLRDCHQQPMIKKETLQSPFYEAAEMANNPVSANKPSMISKWLESAANFRPSEDNYLNWTLAKVEKKKCLTTTNINNNHPTFSTVRKPVIVLDGKFENLALKEARRQHMNKDNALDNNLLNQHGREELDAAEALTRLASAHSSVVKIT